VINAWLVRGYARDLHPAVTYHVRNAAIVRRSVYRDSNTSARRHSFISISGHPEPKAIGRTVSVLVVSLIERAQTAID